MRKLKSLFVVASTAFLLASPVMADSQESEMEKAIKADKELHAYLEVEEAPTLASASAMSADLDGNGTLDEVYCGFLGAQSFVAMGLIDKEGKFAYAGFSPVDSTSAPKVSVRDFTGNGSSEVHVISERGESKRVVTLVACVEGKARRIFRETLSAKSVDAMAHNKTTKFINFVDQNKDGIREITVSTRQTELVGSGEGEREIAGSSVTSATVYALKDGVYGVTTHESGVLSEDAQLAVATTLANEGETLRARAMLGNLLKASGLDDQVALAGMALLSRIDDSVNGFKVTERAGTPVKS